MAAFVNLIRHGTLWAGTDFGINRYEEKKEQFQSFKPDERNLTRYHSIAEDANGAVVGWRAQSPACTGFSHRRASSLSVPV